MTKRIVVILCVITIVAAGLACGFACGREEAAPAEFELSNLAISPTEVEIGQTVTVTVDVENVGQAAGTKTLTLKVDGVEVETKDVVVEGGKTEIVSFTLVPDAEGTYSIEVDGLSGSLAVKAPAAEGMVFEDRNANEIRDADEPGLANILVSNGVTVAVTDEAGNYRLPLEGYFVFITTPGDYIATTPWYQDITGEELNFGLAPAPEKNRAEFTFVQMTDIHLDTVPEHRTFFEQAIDEINEIAPAFVMVTGDLVNGADGATIAQAEEWFDAYEESISQLEMPIYNVLGNHDVVGIHCEGVSENEPGYNEEMYRNYFGPTYYSFDWGLYHCLVLDPNEWANGAQFYRIPDYELEWLQQDLAHREEKPLLVFFHEPTTSWQNRTEALDLLEEHQSTIFSGHWHFDVLMDSQGIPEQVTGALCGEWWYGPCSDGSPQGYRIIQVDNEDISSFYKGVGVERQINITSPSTIVSGEVELTAQIYTEHGAIQEVFYQVDSGEPVAMEVEEGELWDVATALWDTTQVMPGYHSITIEARDANGEFFKELEVKVSDEEVVPISELVSHFDAYQGQQTNIQGEVSFALIGVLGAPEGTGAIIMADETGSMVIIAGECISPPLPNLAMGDLITVKAMPMKLSWEFIQTSAEFSMIEPYVGWLPEGLLEKDGNGNIKAIKVMRLLSGEDIQKTESSYGPSQVHFPEDEGAHPQFAVEWWYLNSTLMDSEGREYTAMAAYFRPTLKILSICDLEAEAFYQEVPSVQELLTTTPDYAVGYFDLRWDDSDHWYRTDQDSFSYHLEARDTDIGLNLDLVSEKPPLMVGGDGLIEWTDGSTYYYSLTRLQVDGEIELAGKTINVWGIGWMDHQWMESIAERGWDWFSVQLDNDTEIIFWQIVNLDGSTHSRDLTMMFPDGSVYHTADLELEMMESWVSPETGNQYGVLWRVQEETHDLDLEISARYAEQEIRVFEDFELMDLDFWEGGTTVSGYLDGEPVSGVGYAELVPPPQE